MHMHCRAICKLMYGFSSVRAIIHFLRLMDYLPVQTHKRYIYLLNIVYTDVRGMVVHIYGR